MRELNILICDDEKVITELLVSDILKYYQRRLINVNLATFNDSKKALKYLMENKIDAAFLDIEMDYITGIDLAKAIRNNSVDTYIIFVTGYDEYKNQVFSFHVFDYITKPITSLSILTLLDELTLYISNKIGNKEERELIKTEFGIMGFDIKTIVCFEKVNRKVLIHLSNGEVFQTNSTIRILNNQFQKYKIFFNPHKSFIINLNSISLYQYKNYLIKLTNGMNIPLSQLKLKEFRKAYITIMNRGSD